MNGNNDLNLLTSDDIDGYLKSNLHTGDVMNELHPVINDK